MPATPPPADLLAAARTGDRRALARLLSSVERGGDVAREVSRVSWPAGGQAYTVGITGAPGAGKSTLTGALVGVLRKRSDRVSVLAIDPTSPFSGGAILGDRVRMQDHATDPGVFIRSMATRGHLGGLSLATPAAVAVLDAAGWPWVVIETVGVGQVEVEIAAAADTTVVVVNPGWGDAVQANKAGLLEIADVFVVNKADRAGAADTRRDLEAMLDMAAPGASGGWRPPVLPTVAATGEGVPELLAAVEEHRRFVEAAGALASRRSARVREELREIVVHALAERAGGLCAGPRWAEAEQAVVERRVDPWTAAETLLDTPAS